MLFSTKHYLVWLLRLTPSTYLKGQGATGILTGSPNPYDDYTEFDEFGGQR